MRFKIRPACQVVAFGVALLLGSAAHAQPRVETANYQRIVVADLNRAIAGIDELVRRLEANDVAGAKRAWNAARVGWERSEAVIGEYFPQQAAVMDPWPNASQGFHAVEAPLFGRSDAAAALPAARDLQANAAMLRQNLQTMSLTPQGLLNGMTALAAALRDAKSNGAESRISKTSIYDLQHNYDGIRALYAAVFAKPLAEVDPGRSQQIGNQIASLGRTLHHDNVEAIDKAALKTESETLVRMLNEAAPALGLQPPMVQY